MCGGGGCVWGGGGVEGAECAWQVEGDKPNTPFLSVEPASDAPPLPGNAMLPMLAQADGSGGDRGRFVPQACLPFPPPCSLPPPPQHSPRLLTNAALVSSTCASHAATLAWAAATAAATLARLRARSTPTAAASRARTSAAVRGRGRGMEVFAGSGCRGGIEVVLFFVVSKTEHHSRFFFNAIEN